MESTQLPDVQTSVSDTEDDMVSIHSTQSECLLTGDDRVGSSLSMASKVSRIPQLQRIAFTRGDRRSVGSIISPNKPQHEQPPNIGGLYRSASFSSSRGLTGLGSCAGYGNFVPTIKPKAFYTPEMNRRIVSYVSPYSKKAIMADRLTHKSHQRKLAADDEDDNESIKSFGSASSTGSCDAHCNAGVYGPNGRPKNVIHCRHAPENPDDYLTPTQRAMRKIKELQATLKNCHKELLEKDCKISTLTRELVEYRFLRTEQGIYDQIDQHPHNMDMDKPQKPNYKQVDSKTKRPQSASPRLGTPAKRASPTPLSDGSEPELTALTHSTNGGLSTHKSSFGSGVMSPESDSADLSRSIADSGHYDDLPSPCLSSKDVYPADRRGHRKSPQSLSGREDSSLLWNIGAAEERIRVQYERKIDELKLNQMNEYHELKEKHNDHVETLLGKLSDANLRYFEMRPEFEKVQEKLRDMEKERDHLKEELIESGTRHQKVYLQMYIKGQQAAKLEAEQMKAQSHLSQHTFDYGLKDLPSLDSDKYDFTFGMAKQLAEAEHEILRLKLSNAEASRPSRTDSNLGRPDNIDPEITLQFLKSAIYYFLTDKDNSQGHLRAIESILGYSSTEKSNISKVARV